MNNNELTLILHALGVGDALLGKLLNSNPQRVKAWRHGGEVIPPHVAQWAKTAMRRVNDQARILAERCPAVLIIWPCQQTYDDYAYTTGHWWEWNAVASAVFKQSLSWPSGAVGLVEFDYWLYTAWLGDTPHSQGKLDEWASWWHGCPIKVAKPQTNDDGELVVKLSVQTPEGGLQVVRQPMGIPATDDEAPLAIATAILLACEALGYGGLSHE
jgi:hypothetical protein